MVTLVSSLIDEFHRIHNHKYQYYFPADLVVSPTARLGVECPIHGIVEQLVRNHYRHGCKKCAMQELRDRKFYTQEECLRKFIDKHGDRYDYSLVCYTNQGALVTIICRIHGPFEQSPLIHWRGGNCHECRMQSKKQKLRKTTASFIADAVKLWGNRWDYSKANYVDGKTPITIGCLDHGDFSIPARHHLIGIGCSRCTCGRSDIEEIWLDQLNVPSHFRHKRVTFPDGTYLVPDGCDDDNKIVYLFMGDYWHGNPAIYPSGKTHPTLKRNHQPVTFGQIYQEALDDIYKYQKYGYQTIVEWESNFTPKNRLSEEISLDYVKTVIPDVEHAYRFLNDIRFANGLACPYCGSVKVWNSQKRGLIYCLEKACRKSFNSRNGTFFHGSQIALHKWLYGLYLIKSSRRTIATTAVAIRIGVGREAARVIKDAVHNRQNQALVSRIMFGLNCQNVVLSCSKG